MMSSTQTDKAKDTHAARKFTCLVQPNPMEPQT